MITSNKLERVCLNKLRLRTRRDFSDNRKIEIWRTKRGSRTAIVRNRSVLVLGVINVFCWSVCRPTCWNLVRSAASFWTRRVFRGSTAKFGRVARRRRRSGLRGEVEVRHHLPSTKLHSKKLSWLFLNAGQFFYPIMSIASNFLNSAYLRQWRPFTKSAKADPPATWLEEKLACIEEKSTQFPRVQVRWLWLRNITRDTIKANETIIKYILKLHFRRLQMAVLRGDQTNVTAFFVRVFFRRCSVQLFKALLEFKEIKLAVLQQRGCWEVDKWRFLCFLRCCV